MTKLPSKLYYIKVVPGGTPLKFRQKGGGLYSNKSAALSQYNVLKGQGTIASFYELDCGDWKEIPMNNPMEDEPTLW